MNDLVADVQNDPNGAVSCNPKECRLPNCWCSSDGTQVPGNLTASMAPQMITVTFDDAVNAENFELFSSRRSYQICSTYSSERKLTSAILSALAFRNFFKR